MAQALVVVALMAGTFLLTLFGVWRYRAFARRRGIKAEPNFRSLHQGPVPRGGGLVFSAVSILAVAGLWSVGLIAPTLARALIVAGIGATLVGFVDDAIQIRPLWKLLAQMALAALVLISFDARPLIDIHVVPNVVELALSWLGLVWLLNVYNFMDGVDGMASSGAIFMSTAVIAALIAARIGGFSSGDEGLTLVCAVIVACNSAFMVFNRPPASIFMGDAGSLFLGVFFSVLLVKTVVEAQISLWTWVVIFGYFAGDTTTTSIIRIFVTPKWYAEHRSHAYQNLARVWHSHSAVVLGVTAYSFAWLLPLVIWSMLAPALAPVAAVCGLLPVVLWTLRHGPLRSSA